MRAAALLLLACLPAQAAEPFAGSVALPNGLTVHFGPSEGPARAGGLHAKENRVTRIVLDPQSGDYYGYVLEVQPLGTPPGRYRVRFLTLEAAGVGPKEVAATAGGGSRAPLRPLVLSPDVLPVPSTVGDGETLQFQVLVNAAGERIGDTLRFSVPGAPAAGLERAGAVEAPEYDLRTDVEELAGAPERYAARFRLWHRGELLAQPRVEFVRGTPAQFRQGIVRPNPAESLDLQAEVRLERDVALARVELRRGARLELRYELSVPIRRR